MITINSGKDFAFTIDLREAFEFPADETGKYELTSGDASLSFRIQQLPNLVISTFGQKGTHRHSHGVEYAVVRSEGKKDSCELWARQSNGVFNTIYVLDFTPTVIFGRQLEDAPGCATGCLVVLSSATHLHVLSPGQAYHGKIPGDRCAKSIDAEKAAPSTASPDMGNMPVEGQEQTPRPFVARNPFFLQR